MTPRVFENDDGWFLTLVPVGYPLPSKAVPFEGPPGKPITNVTTKKLAIGSAAFASYFDGSDESYDEFSASVITSAKGDKAVIIVFTKENGKVLASPKVYQANATQDGSLSTPFPVTEPPK